MEQNCFAFSSFLRCKMWHLSHVLLLMKVHCMIFLWPVMFSCQDSGAWAQWHFFNLSIFKEFIFWQANQYFGSGSRVSETFWYLGQFCQLTPGGNWSCCIRRATVLELGERGEELPKARQVWPHNERYLHPTKSLNVFVSLDLTDPDRLEGFPVVWQGEKIILFNCKSCRQRLLR